MPLLELFPTIVGVFACDTFDRDVPVWRASVPEAIAERDAKFATPQHQTDDRLHERAEFGQHDRFLSAVRYRLHACA